MCITIVALKVSTHLIASQQRDQRVNRFTRYYRSGTFCPYCSTETGTTLFGFSTDPSRMDGSNGSITLAFDLDALRELADPERVFNDAHKWSEYVGVVSDQPTYVVTNYTRQHHIRQDFFSGPRSRDESLVNVKQQFDTDRHVFIGPDENDAAAAETAGWEYLTVDAAAEAADWVVGESETQTAAPAADDGRDDWP